jgi:hypothetical protein
LKPPQKEGWRSYGLIIWDKKSQQVAKLWASQALRVLAELRNSDYWKETPLTANVTFREGFLYDWYYQKFIGPRQEEYYNEMYGRDLMERTYARELERAEHELEQSLNNMSSRPSSCRK